MCEWFVDDKLTIHFCEDKSKCIPFSKEKNLPELNIYNNERKSRIPCCHKHF